VRQPKRSQEVAIWFANTPIGSASIELAGFEAELKAAGNKTHDGELRLAAREFMAAALGWRRHATARRG